MKILMLTWEYPPRVIGGLARHVHALSQGLVREGHEVVVVTGDDGQSPYHRTEQGVEVYRVKKYSPPTMDFLDSVFQLNLNMAEEIIHLREQGLDFDLIHAHDWLVAYAGKVIKHAYHRPLVATIHATEYGRNQGLHNDLQRYISSVEWWLGYEAWRVICCSHYMFDEVSRVFQLPRDKVSIVPNGVTTEEFQPTAEDLGAFRNNYAAPKEKIIYFIGRLVNEKGVGVLMEAAPKVFARYPDCKFVISGKGPAGDYLQRRARELGIAHRFYFTGFVDDATRNNLYRVADIAVFPSLYEPFGIVALEAMAAGVPVVVSDVGGFGEIVDHGRNGLKAYPGNPDSLADNLTALLLAPGLAKKLQERAFQEVQDKYSWDRIARQTADIYGRVLDEYQRTPWEGMLTPEEMEEKALVARITSFLNRQGSRYQATGKSLWELVPKG